MLDWGVVKINHPPRQILFYFMSGLFSHLQRHKDVEQDY